MSSNIFDFEPAKDYESRLFKIINEHYVECIEKTKCFLKIYQTFRRTFETRVSWFKNRSLCKQKEQICSYGAWLPLTFHKKCWRHNFVDWIFWWGKTQWTFLFCYSKINSHVPLEIWLYCSWEERFPERLELERRVIKQALLLLTILARSFLAIFRLADFLVTVCY